MITTTKALHESKVALEKLGQPLFNANVHVWKYLSNVLYLYKENQTLQYNRMS